MCIRDRSKEDLIKRMVSLEFNRFLHYYRDREEIEIATGSERSAKSGERGSNARKATPGFKAMRCSRCFRPSLQRFAFRCQGETSAMAKA